ncbi:MAG: endonuclease/exonuclease/phosphatase family protein, partial [Nitriliruptoraceae bacterium]
GRAGLIVASQPSSRLIMAAVATTAAGVALVALAGGTRPDTDRAARTGVVLGVAAATTLHAATATRGLIWPEGTVTTVASLAVVLAVLAVLVPAARGLAAPSAADDAASSAAWPWWGLAPLLVLTAVISGVPGRVAIATGWEPSVVAVTIALGQAGAVVAALLAARVGGFRAGGAGAVLVLIGTVLGSSPTGWPGVVGQVSLAIGLGAILGSDPPRSGAPGLRGVRRRALCSAGALLAALGAIAVYYLAYALPMPGDNRVVLLAVGALGMVLGGATAWTSRARTVEPTVDVRQVVRIAAALLLVVTLTGVGGGIEQRSGVLQADGDLRVATYNVNAGFDADGRFDPLRQSRVLREHAPDVVVLNEVDRGWLATGGHDALPLLAAELGLPHVRFGGTGDELVGNALLSRFPITEFATEQLPRGSDPMPRGAIAAVLDLHDGDSLGVVGTQLSQEDERGGTRLPQARAVAATVARLRERQVPTVVLGDLHTQQDATDLASFGSLVDNVLPAGTVTYPARAPSSLHSHVLASRELRRLRLDIPTVDASSHLPVIVTFRRVAAL